MSSYVIDKIIERTERSSLDWKKGAAGNRSFPLKEYHENDYKKVRRSDFAAQVRALELEGLLQCRWYERYSELDKVTYRLEDLPEFYRRAGRREKYLRQELLLQYICHQKTRVECRWIMEYLQELENRLGEGKVPGDLKAAEIYLHPSENPVDNWQENPEGCGQLELFAVLRSLDSLREPVYKRVFSSGCLKDRVEGGKVLKASKVFEHCYQGAVLSIVRRYHPDVDDSMDDTQALSQIYLEEYAQQLAVKGPLRLVLNGEEIDLAPFRYGAVLNSQTLKYGNPSTGQEIRRIITVENQANYEAMPYEEGTLVIFCHGYFTPREREFLKKLYECLKGKPVEYYHTGDLDYGGVCIFRYNRERIFPELKPLWMDVAQYERYLHKAEPLDPGIVEKLRMLDEPLLQPLIGRMVEAGMGVEQENFL